MGTNNISHSAAQDAQFNFFLFPKAQRNFRNKLFNLVEAQRNPAIAERDFRTKSKRNLTSAVKEVKTPTE